MNSIKHGQVYEAKRIHSGEDWEMIITQNDKGQHEIVLYVSNRPSHVEEGNMFKVTEIKGMSSICTAWILSQDTSKFITSSVPIFLSWIRP